MRKQAVGFMMALQLGFCQTTGDGPLQFTSDTYCQIAKPVQVSKRDTRRTKELADIEYRKYVAVCGAKQ